MHIRTHAGTHSEAASHLIFQHKLINSQHPLGPSEQSAQYAVLNRQLDLAIRVRLQHLQTEAPIMVVFFLGTLELIIFICF